MSWTLPSSRPFSLALLGCCLLSGGLLGCAENSVLEIELDLPPSEGGIYRYAQARVISLDTPSAPSEETLRAEFTPQWGALYPLPVELDPTARTTDCVSIVSHAEREYLLLKVRFCENSDCEREDPTNTPQAWLSLEHPFYIGRRTRLVWGGGADELPTIPTTETDPTTRTIHYIGRCEISGCVGVPGGGPAPWSCTDDGRHYCEVQGNQDFTPNADCPQ